MLANEVDFAPGRLDDDVHRRLENGHDKAAHVRAARARGRPHRVHRRRHQRFRCGAREPIVGSQKKTARSKHICRARGVACTSFASFREIERGAASDSGWQRGSAPRFSRQEGHRFDQLRILIGVAGADLRVFWNHRLMSRLDADRVDIVAVRREVARGRDLHGRTVAQREDRLHDTLAVRLGAERASRRRYLESRRR